MDPGQQIFELLKDPNVAYVLLFLGLWMAVVAVTTPGTGFAEVAALLALALAAVGLFNITVNFAGIFLIIVGFALFAVDVFATTHGVLTIGGATALLIGSLILFPQREGAASLSGVLVIGVTVASLGMGGVVLHALFRTRQRGAVDLAALHVDGQVGRVSAAIVAGEMGTVQVAGQEWSAMADEPIERGVEVIVIGQEGLTLRVAPKQKQAA
jgi:membrane-bound serine protease (ClpP class)